jgi:hypothetical protein
MAAIVISSPSGATLNNVTDNFIPYKFSSNSFSDSILYQNSTNDLRSIDVNTGNAQGIIIDNDNGNYQFGDIDGMFTGANMQVSPDGNINITAANKLILNTNSLIEMNGLITAVSAGGNAGLHLELTINGTKYKIQLLDV